MRQFIKKSNVLIISLIIIFIAAITGCSYFYKQPSPTPPAQKVTPNTALDKVLVALSLERQDLGITRPLPQNDPFLLNKVSLFLHSPMQIHSFAEESNRRLQTAHPTLSSLIAFGADNMELTITKESSRRAPMPCTECAGLPTALREAVEGIYQAEVCAREVFEEAFSGLTLDERLFVRKRFEEFLSTGTNTNNLSRREEQDLIEKAVSLAARINRQKMLEAALIVASAVDTAVEMLKKENISHLQERLHSDKKVMGTPLGEIIIGGSGNNHYTGTMPLLLIDIGGDDEYSFTEYNPFSVIIDLSGNDLYNSSVSAPLGAGILGMGFLIDLEGDDQYLGSNFSFGCGFMGVGILLDERGNDRYISRTMTQGAGALGLGILCDAEGNDFYQCTLYGQGFGFVGGSGLLLNYKGNDKFIAGGEIPDFREKSGAFQSCSQGFGMGCRNFAAGGIGILYSGQGDDTYEGSYFCQGSSYWLAIGMLIDAKGNDRYQARRYSQGAGVHSSIGALVDLQGNDIYASWGVSQGCGHDRSIGMLWDSRGNDRYTAEWLSQGSGNDAGLGLLIDEQGDDAYTAGVDGTQGSGKYDERRDEVSIGILVDAGGKNVFTGKGKDKKLWASGQVGGGIGGDGSMPAVWSEPYEKAQRHKGAEAAGKSGTRGSGLGVRGNISAPSTQNKSDLVPELEAPLVTEESWEKAAGALAGRAPAIIPALLAYMDIKDVVVLRTLEETFKKIGKKNVQALHAVVLQNTIAPSKKTILLYVLGDLANPRSQDLFLKLLDNQDAKIQALALRGLYKLKVCPPVKDAKRLAQSESVDVRKYLALSLRGSDNRAAAELLKKLQQDRDFNVRYAAMKRMN